jgi:hypothetical protein
MSRKELPDILIEVWIGIAGKRPIGLLRYLADKESIASVHVPFEERMKLYGIPAKLKKP